MEATITLPSGGRCVAYMFFGAATAIIIGGIAIAGLEAPTAGYAEGHNLHFLNQTFTSLKVDDSFNLVGGIGCTIGAIGAIAFGYGLIQGVRVASVPNPPQKDESFIDPRTIEIDEISGWHQIGREQIPNEKNKLKFDPAKLSKTLDNDPENIIKTFFTIRWIDEKGNVYTAYNPYSDCKFTEEEIQKIREKLSSVAQLRDC